MPRYLLPGSLVLFVVSYFAARFTELPGAWVGSYVSTVLIALPAFAALWGHMGARRAAVLLGALGVFGFAIETTGTVTGFPYGSFFYGDGDALGPKLAGHVPYILPVSYLPFVIGAVAGGLPR